MSHGYFVLLKQPRHRLTNGISCSQRRPPTKKMWTSNAATRGHVQSLLISFYGLMGSCSYPSWAQLFLSNLTSVQSYGCIKYIDRDDLSGYQYCHANSCHCCSSDEQFLIFTNNQGCNNMNVFNLINNRIAVY